MDYVVFGIGFGATILVLGLLLRDFGSRLRYRAPHDGDDVLSAEQLVGKIGWTRFCAALGSVLALAGAAFLIITLVSMVLVVSDDTGLWVMGVSYGLLILLMAYWTWAYFHRFGSYGILPERVEKPKPVLTPAGARRPTPNRTQVFVGPTPPAGVVEPMTEEPEPIAAEAAAEPESAETAEGSEAAAAEDERAVESVPGEGESPTEPVETAASDEQEAESPDERESATTTRLETPEERLAHHDTPIDHGSAEGDLDLAASPGRRPGPRLARGQAGDADAPTSTAGPPIPSDLESRD